MESLEYKVIQFSFAALTLLCVVFFLIGFKKILNKSDYSQSRKSKIWYYTFGGIFLWLLIVSILSISGITQDFSVPPKMFFVVVPPLIVAIYLIFNGKSDRLLAETPHSWLIGFQSFRVLVEILLWALLALNLIPVQMSLEGLNWDILTGITAPIIVFLYIRLKLPKWSLLIWNIVGLILLINIVVISILSAPVPFRVFMNEPANRIVTFFPIVFLPSVLVPFAYFLHFFSLRKLYMERKK